MYLKRLDLYGFKSFASRTTFEFGARHNRHRRAERLRQVQHRGRTALGAGRTVGPPVSREEAGRRHLRRVREAPAFRQGRGHDDARQLQRLAADRNLRGRHLSQGQPLRRQRLLHQRQEDSPPGAPDPADESHRHPELVRHHRAGARRDDPQPARGRPPRTDRRSGGHPALPAEDRRGRGPAEGDARERRTREAPDEGDRARGCLNSSARRSEPASTRGFPTSYRRPCGPSTSTNGTARRRL